MIRMTECDGRENRNKKEGRNEGKKERTNRKDSINKGTLNSGKNKLHLSK